VPDVGDPVDVGKAARSGDSAAVEVRGKPSEILLLAYNRKEVARVTVVGARDALMSARLGL
jgi:hypothetical protein